VGGVLLIDGIGLKGNALEAALGPPLAAAKFGQPQRLSVSQITSSGPTDTEQHPLISHSAALSRLIARAKLPELLRRPQK